MRFTRQQYIDLMTFQKPQKQMFSELFGPMKQLEPEWRAQGATPGEMDMTDFCWDYVPTVSCGGVCGAFGGPKEVIVEENEEFTISIDTLGRRMKLCKAAATIPLPMDYPVTDMDSWLKIKPLFQYRPDRVDQQKVMHAKQLQADGALVTANIPGGFDLPRELMGEANLCIAFYEDPELIADILNTAGETAYRVLDAVSDVVTIDLLHVHEDMAGKSGPLIGPVQVREFIAPYYQKIWNLLSNKGTRLFSQDSDGDMSPVIDAFLDAGINIMYPAEPCGGMDIVALRQKYGTRLAFKGGINKHVLRGTKEEIKKELTYKMQPLMQQGGTVFGLDHRIPNGTPLENYKYYVQLGRELLGREPIEKDEKGWARMAF